LGPSINGWLLRTDSRRDRRRVSNLLAYSFNAAYDHIFEASRSSTRSPPTEVTGTPHRSVAVLCNAAFLPPSMCALCFIGVRQHIIACQGLICLLRAVEMRHRKRNEAFCTSRPSASEPCQVRHILAVKVGTRLLPKLQLTLLL
jgi:hypothetical protein